MPDLYGLLPTGFAPMPQTVVAQQLTTSIKALRGASFDCTGGSLTGMWIGILSEREAAIWDVMQAIDSSQDPDKATDAAQDALCTLTGSFRGSARSSQVTGILTGDPTTVVGQGSIVNTLSTNKSFVTVAPATIVALASRAISTLYALDARVTNGGGVWQCIVSGTSDSGAGPQPPAGSPPPPGAVVVDGSATWVFLGLGTGAVEVIMLSSEQDEIACDPYDLANIRTPTGGWLGCANKLAAVLGAPVQSNESLRVSRENELVGEGTGPADAIRAALLKGGVTSCTVQVNDTDLVDGNGQAPHSVQAIVEGGEDATIAAILKRQVGAGIQTIGTTTVMINDSQGTPQAYKFTRVEQVIIYVSATYTYNPAPISKGGYSTTQGTALAQTAIASLGNSRSIGRDVVASSLAAALFPIFVNGVQVAGVQGILDVTELKISTTPFPTLSTTITITPFQRAVFSPINVIINSSPGTV